MRVLVVDEEIPFPLNSGKRIRTFNLLKHLSSHHEISYVCRWHAGGEKPDPEALETVGIKPLVIADPILQKAGPKFYFALGANVFSRLPYSVVSHYSPKLIAAISSLFSQRPFDLIHCEWTPYLANLASFRKLPIVNVAHNVESMIWRRNFETERNAARKAYCYLQWKKMEIFEQNALSSVTSVVAVSEEDKSRISQWADPDRVTVVENGVDTDYFTPAVHNAASPHSLVFTGALDWRPNVDCMMYFMKEIWPLVLDACPDASLVMVGRNPMDALKDCATRARSVTLTGTVPDVRPYVEEAAVYIVPLRIGGGSRLKILEALSMGKAVVSTTVGAEGLRTENGRELMIADGPHEFAHAVIRLFHDSDLRKRLGAAGRVLVEQHYQWAALANKLEAVWFAATQQAG